MLTITPSLYSNDRHLIQSLDNIAKQFKFLYCSFKLRIIMLPVKVRRTSSTLDNNHTLWTLTPIWNTPATHPVLLIADTISALLGTGGWPPTLTTHVGLLIFIFIYVKIRWRFIKRLLDKYRRSTATSGRNNNVQYKTDWLKIYIYIYIYIYILCMC